MIDKLHSHPIYTDDGRGITGLIRPSASEIVDKLNEIIDVFNSFEVTTDKPMFFTNEQKAWVKDRIISNGLKSYECGAKDFAEWLISRSMLCDSFGQDMSECYDGDNNKAIEDVLAEWKKEVENEN